MDTDQITLNPRQIRYLASIGVISPSFSKGGKGKKRQFTEQDMRVLKLVIAVKEKGVNTNRINPIVFSSYAANPAIPFIYVAEGSNPFAFTWDGENCEVAFDVLGIANLYAKATELQYMVFDKNIERWLANLNELQKLKALEALNELREKYRST